MGAAVEHDAAITLQSGQRGQDTLVVLDGGSRGRIVAN